MSEILGGTRQLQVISSIMNNWEDAQNAYADAMDSAGVATQAQETYMTSLQAKTDQFNASMQEFYYDFLDSDLAKGVVDFGTEIVQAFDSILDKVGSVTTAIAGVGLFSMVQSVGKAFSYAAKNGVTFGQGLSSVSSTVGALTKGMTAFNQAYYAGGTGLFQSVGIGISTFVSKLGPLTKALAVIAAVTAGITLFNQVYKSSEDIIKEGQEAQTNIDDIYNEYQSQASKVRNYGERYEELSFGVNVSTNENISLTNEEYDEYLSLCNEIAEIYPQLVTSYDEQGNAILNLGSSAETATEQLDAMLEKDREVASENIGEDNIDKVIRGMKTELDEYDKFLDEFDSINTKEQGIIDDMGALSADFDEAIRSAFAGNGTEPITMSNDLFNAIGEDLAIALNDAGIVTSVFRDAEGVTFFLTPIVDKEDVEDVATEVEDEIPPVAFDTTVGVVDESQIEDAIGGHEEDSIIAFDPVINPFAPEQLDEVTQGAEDEIDSAFELDTTEWAISEDQMQDMVENANAKIDIEAEANESQIEEAVDEAEGILNREIYKQTVDSSSEINSNQLDARVAERELNDSIESGLQSTFNYYATALPFELLTDEIQNGISDAISGIGSDVLEGFKDDENGSYEDQLKDYIKSKYITPILGAFLDENVSEDTQNAFTNLFSLDTSKLTSSEYDNKVQSNLDEIANYYKEQIGVGWQEYFSDFVVNFGFGVVLDDGTIQTSANDASQELYNIFEDELSNSPRMNEIFEGLTVDEKQAMLDYVNDPSVAEDAASSFASVYHDVVEEAQDKIASEPTLASLFTTTEGEETQFSKDIDTFQSDIDSINSSLDDLRNGEEVNVMDLFQDFPQLEGSLDDLESGLEGVSIDKLHEFSKAWTEATEGLEGDQLEETSKLFQNAISSIDFSSVIDNYEEAVSSYENTVAEMEAVGTNVDETIWGNIDTNNRQVLEWTEKNIKANEEAIESWGMSIDTLGDYSTELGRCEEFNGIEIAFSPMLQTEDGAVLLDKDTVYTYINSLMDELEGEEFTSEDLFSLDAVGLDIEGEHIQGLLAGVADEAVYASEAMHFTGDTGAIAAETKNLKEAENDLKSIAFSNLIAPFDQSELSYEDFQHYSQEIDSLFERYAGDSVGLDAMLRVLADPSAAEKTVTELASEIEDTKVEIEVEIEYQETIDKLDKNLSKIQTSATKLENEMSRKDVFGIQYSQQDYRDLINNMNLQLQNLRAQKSVMEEYAASLDPLDSKYAEVASEIQSVESEIISAIGDQQEWNAAAAELSYEAGEALSAYNDATSTRNAGDNYTDMIKVAEETQSAYENFLTGTDEFKAGVALFSRTGASDVETWEETYEKVARYFTEDTEGTGNAVHDLAENFNSAGKAMAVYDEATNSWAIDNSRIQENADALGISLEAYSAIMGRLQDYGFTSDWFDSIDEGAAHIGDLYYELAQAEMKFQDMQADTDRFSTEDLARQEEYINGIKTSISNSYELIDEYATMSAETFVDQEKANYQAVLSMADQVSALEAMGADERSISNYLQGIATYAEEKGIDISGLLTLGSEGNYNGICQEVYDELEQAFGEASYDLDLSTTFQDQLIGDVGQTLQEACADTESGVQEMVDSIVAGFTSADLAGIQFNTGSYTEGFEEAEAAVDDLLKAMGLGQESGEALTQILSSLIDLGEGATLEDAMQSVAESVDETSRTTLAELQESEVISPDIEFDADISEMSLDEVENQIGLLTEAKEAIDIDPTLDDASKIQLTNGIDSMINELQSRDIELKVDTAIEGGENDIDSLMSMYESGNLAGFAQALGIEVDFEADTSELDAAYAELQSMDQQEEITATINAVLEESGLSEVDLLGMNEAQLGSVFEQELELHPTVSMQDIESQLGYQEVEMPVIMQLEESQFEALTSQTEEVDVEVNTDDIAGQIESAVASASPTVDVTVNADEVAGQIQAAAEGVEVTIPVAFETSGTDIDTVSTAAPTPQSTSVQVTASVSGEEEVNSLTGAIEAVNSKYVDVVANVSGTAEVRALIAAINSLTGKVVSVSAIVSGIGEVNSLAASIAAVQSKTVTVTTITQNISSGGDEHGSGALGTAHASGTAYSMWTGYRHSIGAYADGSTQDWALPRNEQAIVNEIGTESIVYFCDFTWRHVLKNLFNCWEPVKPTKLQRKDEICLSANVAKAEKISWMMHGANLNIV